MKSFGLRDVNVSLEPGHERTFAKFPNSLKHDDTNRSLGISLPQTTSSSFFQIKQRDQLLQIITQ